MGREAATALAEQYQLVTEYTSCVVVLERAEMLGLGSTGLNAGGVRHQFSTTVNIELSRLSIGRRCSTVENPSDGLPATR